MKLPRYKVIYRYKNITLWKNNPVLKQKFLKRKWIYINNKKNYRYYLGNASYICHYKKLKLERLYSFKFMNKQILKKYLVNYKEYNFKNYLLNNYLNFERRLDFNLYKSHFVESLYAARFYIIKGFILVNGKKVTSFNFLLKKNDKVEINKKYYDFIVSRCHFNNIKDLYYIRNIEIDYKTFSFIFLDNKEFYIINYRNFFKHIYCLKFRNKKDSRRTKHFKKLYHSNAELEYNKSLRKYRARSKYIFKDPKLNNYFIFFDYVFKYYLFLDKKHKFLQKRYNRYFMPSYKIYLLSKCFKKKYSNYFFRNILLKRTFNYKYNFLKLIQKNLCNFNDFENIDSILSKNNNIEKNDEYKLNDQYFKYYYNLIYKFYLYLLRNYYITRYSLNITNRVSLNNYNYIILLNRKLFRILNLKNKLLYYYNYKFKDSLFSDDLRKYRQIKYSYIPKKFCDIPVQKYTRWKKRMKRRERYFSSTRYNDFINFIYSRYFRLKFHRYRWKNWKSKNKKRRSLIIYLMKTFEYDHYNISKVGAWRPIKTKRLIYNKLCYNFKKRKRYIYKLKRKNKRVPICKLYLRSIKYKRTHYPLFSDVYKFVYANIKNITYNEKLNIKKDTNKLLYLIKINHLNKRDFKLILNNLKTKYNLINYNKKYRDYNYNYHLRDLFLLSKLMQYYKKDIIDLNLKHHLFNYIYKGSLKLRKYRKKKYYSIYICRRDRIPFEFIERRINLFIPYNKPKLKLFGNVRSFILDYNYRKTSIKPIYLKIHNIKHLVNYKHFIKSKYKYKNPIIKNNLNVSYINNMNIINSDFKFVDSLFFISLFLNLNIRKLNKLYNYVNYRKITKKELSRNYNISNIRTKIRSKIYVKKRKRRHIKSKRKYIYFINNKNYNYINKYSSLYHLCENNNLISLHLAKKKKFNYIFKYKLRYLLKSTKKNNHFIKCVVRIKKRRKFIIIKNRYSRLYMRQYFKKFRLIKKKNNIKLKVFKKLKKNYNINNIYKIYLYYSVYYKKYQLIKYLFNNYIFKEYDYILDRIILKNLNIKTYDKKYIKQLYFNLIYTEFFNLKKYDRTLYGNFKYVKDLKIMINYFILIKRFYK